MKPTDIIEKSTEMHTVYKSPQFVSSMNASESEQISLPHSFEQDCRPSF